MEIFCSNLGKYIEAFGGESLADIYTRLQPQIEAKQPGFHPIGAHINNKSKGLGNIIFGPCQVSFFDSASPSGNRMYVRSLCMILCKAVSDLFPGSRLRIEHTISNGYFCKFSEGVAPDEATAAKIKARMREIVDQNLPFERIERRTVDAVEEFRRHNLTDKLSLFEGYNEVYTTYYKLADTIDSFYGYAAPSTGYIKYFDLIPYKTGMLLLGQDTANPGNVSKPIKQDKMFQALADYKEFNSIVRIKDVGMLNKVIREGYAPLLINVVEALHNKRLGEIAAEIVKRYRENGCRIVLIAGPSSSGKTTTSKRLAVHLLTNIISPKVIELDNYFVNRDTTPRDENGDYDFESLYSVDLKQLNEDLNRLIAGQEVAMPTYNFETGKREYRGNTLRLNEGEILLLEGIHGLNPELTKDIPNSQKFLVYVSALTTLSIDDHNWISTSDTRLLRRIIRDYKYRGMSPHETIRRWPSVRRGENKWIFPFQENADATFNSSLLFEIGVLRSQALEALRKVPHNEPEYADAVRLINMLNYFAEVPENEIPASSLLREFLGGSVFSKF